MLFRQALFLIVTERAEAGIDRINNAFLGVENAF